jgi:hypothetical protein
LINTFRSLPFLINQGKSNDLLFFLWRYTIDT